MHANAKLALRGFSKRERLAAFQPVLRLHRRLNGPHNTGNKLMPKQAKSRRVTITRQPVALIKPETFALLPVTEADIAAFGQPAYIELGADFDHSVIGNGDAPDFDPSLFTVDTDANATIGAHYVTDAGETVTLYDATAPDLPNDNEQPEPEPAPISGSAPPVADTPAANVTTTQNDRALARAAAAKAVATFYAGRSLPFKSAHDLKRKSAVNFALNRDPSERTAALIAAIVTFADVQPGSLTFVRGSGRVPGSLLGLTGADAERTFPAGPESGCLSNCIPDRIEYVSGALAGAGCENAVFKLNYTACRDNLRSFNAKQADGEHLFSAPLALLEMLNAPPTDTSAANTDA